MQITTTGKPRTLTPRLSYQGPRSKFSSGGAKEECMKENIFVKLFFV